MKRILINLLIAAAVWALAFVLLEAGHARAQTSPGWYNGQVLTAGDLNNAFAGKLDLGASTLLTGTNIWTGAQTFQGATTLSGSISANAPVTISATTYAVGTSDNFLICTNASGCTVTLPSASGATGRVLTLKTTGGGAVTSASSNVVPLAGGSAATAILASTAGKWVTLVSDGSHWVAMAGN